jgi:branched-chain amino acid transport system ATP-binding protein
VVEHDMPFVNSLCERVTVMNFGAVIYDGPADGVARDEAVQEAYLGRPRETSDAA